MIINYKSSIGVVSIIVYAHQNTGEKITLKKGARVSILGTGYNPDRKEKSIWVEDKETKAVFPVSPSEIA